MKRNFLVALCAALGTTVFAAAPGIRLALFAPGDGEAPGAVVELPTMGNGGQANGINQWGFVTGRTDTASGWAAFLSGPHGPLDLVGSPGDPFLGAFATNDFGDIVGEGVAADGVYVTFAKIGTALYDLRPTYAADINNEGVVASWSMRAALWRRGRPLQVLPWPGMPPENDRSGAWLSAVSAVNDRGQAAGFYVDETGAPHAVRWEPDGTLVELGFGVAHAINEAGDVAGGGYNAPNFIWRDGVGRTNVEISAFAINDAGQLAGLCGNGTSDEDACVWSESTGIIRLAKPMNGHAQAAGINDLGEVAGALYGADRAHALWWYAPPGIGDQFLAVQRLLRILNEDSILSEGRFTVLVRALDMAEDEQGSGDSAAAAKHLGQMARQLRAWRQGKGGDRDRLIRVEALVSRLGLRLLQ
jgi:uncharacterized membrane protein